MGTFYNIQVFGKNDLNTFILKQKIDMRLKMINKTMSCFLENSELSLFNKTKANIIFKPSNDFFFILKKAENLFKITNGSWDGTVKPLVKLWGFKTKKEILKIPGKKIINNILKNTGFDKIHISKNKILKQNSLLSLDLGSIAKGYGVDAISKLLKKHGFKSFLVEIGGEVFAFGKKRNKKFWKVGITIPLKNFQSQSIYKKIKLKNKAMATSGNYRNFIKIDKKEFSHIIDPKTGYPSTSKVVSASVIANTCTFADGLATALMVMKYKKGLKLVNKLKNTECLIIIKTENGNLKNFVSKNFPEI